MEAKTNRLLALEGLRGVAAVIVVIFHALLIFFPSFYYGPAFNVEGLHTFSFEDNLYGNPLNVFLSGPFAVAIFFVISGFVLTVGFFQTNDQMIIKKLAMKRYIRLALPALASILIVACVLAIGLGTLKLDVQAITQSIWLERIWLIVPNLGEALYQGLVGIFTVGDVSYNPVLWTMQYEFVGSFIVFIVAILFRQSKFRWIIYLALIVGLYNTWYLGFILGMILADLYVLGYFPFTRRKKPLMVLVLFAGLLLGSYIDGVSDGTFYSFLKVSWLGDIQSLVFYFSVGAALVTVAVLTMPKVSKFFESKIISGLGKYTFSLYLMHMVVLFTVGAGFFLLFNSIAGYTTAAVLTIIATLPVVALVTYLFEKYIDAPSIKLSGVFANWMLGLPQKEGDTAFSEHDERVFDKLRTFVKKYTKRK